MTASRALRGAKDVSTNSLEKVQSAARTLGYVGNPLATSLSSQRTDLIGVVLPSLTNIVFSEVLSGIAAGLVGSGKQPVFGVTDYDPDVEQKVVQSMLSWRPAGLIVTGLDQSEHTRILLQNAGIPIVQIMDLDGVPVDACVGLSHEQAGYDMATALMANGRKRFGYVGWGLEKDTRAAKRFSGFQKALREGGLGLQCNLQEAALSSVAAGRRLTAEALLSHPDLDCLYYSNDDVAMGGLFEGMAQGIAVPDQLMIAGFNGLDFVQSLPAPIATSHTSRHEIGRLAARIARQHPEQEARRIEITPRIDIPS